MDIIFSRLDQIHGNIVTGETAQPEICGFWHPRTAKYFSCERSNLWQASKHAMDTSSKSNTKLHSSASQFPTDVSDIEVYSRQLLSRRKASHIDK